MNIPYINQIDSAPRRNDCGPACVVMMTGALFPDRVTPQNVTMLSQLFDAPQDGTTAADLEDMAVYLGITLYQQAVPQYPYIALVDYRRLPYRYQQGGDFGHWIVRLSDTAYHDPLYTGARGANLVTSKAILDTAERECRRWSRTAPLRVGFKETMTQTSGKARIKSTPWNVRRSPSTASSTATGYLLQPGQEFDVLGVVKGDDKMDWGRVTVTVGGVRVGDGFLRADGWQWVTTPTPVPPQPAPADWKHAKYLLGGPRLNEAQAGIDALARGCRSVLFMDNLMGAASAARQYPDARIMARFWFQNAPAPVWLADHAGAGLSDIPLNMWTTCANEADWIGYGTPEELRKRFEYERAFAQAMWAKDSSRKIVIGEFSHGTPDITNPEIVKAFRETYYQFAIQNSARVKIGWHLYTKGKRTSDAPPTDAPMIAPEWFEGRDSSFWTQCGGDKRVIHTSGETGVEAGAGGFNWAGYSDDQFAKWCSWWIGYRRGLPVVMDGACIFQFGYHPNWQGYDVRRFVGVLEDFWKGRRS